MSLNIDQVVAKIDAWRGCTVNAQPLSGGPTSTNNRVDVGGTPYVVRIPSANTDLLAVDGANEYRSTRAAAEAGVGPRVAHYLPDECVMVLEFIHGETMSIAALQAPGMPTRIAQSLRRRHDGPRFLTDFNMFRLVEQYLRTVTEQRDPLPGDYSADLPQVARIEAALGRRPLPSVPCNNDLLAENYIDDGEQLRLIDFEYSGKNDPTFELGNTCQEQQYDEPRQVEMCAAYFGEAFPDKLARMRLKMVMSDVGWALWAAIQSKISTIDFDFWGWAMDRWGRAVTKIDSDIYSASWRRCKIRPCATGERVLEEEDLPQLAEVRLTTREPWPAAGGPA